MSLDGSVQTGGHEHASIRPLRELRAGDWSLAGLTVPADNNKQDPLVCLFAGRHNRNVVPLNSPVSPLKMQ